MRLLLLTVITLLPLAAEVKITYLANEGVLLHSGNTKILIDALFRDSLGDYVRHDASTQEELESGRAPFDHIALTLATHFHLDHWDAGAISRHLRLNGKSIFASTPTATAMIPRSLRPQVRELWTDGEHGLQFIAAGLVVDAFPLIHGKTQNLAYRVATGGTVLVHLGDAEANEANFKTLRARPAPDVAMIPFWWLLSKEGAAFVREVWKPRHIVAFHFGAADAREAAPSLAKAFPNAWLCVKAGESRSY